MAAPFTQTKLDANHGWDPLNDAPIVALNNRHSGLCRGFYRNRPK